MWTDDVVYICAVKIRDTAPRGICKCTRSAAVFQFAEPREYHYQPFLEYCIWRRQLCEQVDTDDTWLTYSQDTLR